MNRIAEGWCNSVNPFNRNFRKVVSLEPDRIACFVFWTRFSRPLRLRLDELDDRGFRYYFLFTLLDYHRKLEPRMPGLEARVDDFLALSSATGAERLIWRYDPIIVSSAYPFSYHIETFSTLSEKLRGATHKVIFSFADRYGKQALTEQELPAAPPETLRGFTGFLKAISSAADTAGFALQTCSEPAVSARSSIKPGKCIDDVFIKNIFGLNVPSEKDPGQRKFCRCVRSVDIGAYNTCLFGCRYCYAVGRRETVRANRKRHDPSGPALLP